MSQKKHDIVYIRDLEVETIIGIYDWEREIKQIVSIDLEMAGDIRKAAETDDIQYALNYKLVGKRIIKFVEESEFQLVETMAEQIAQIVLSEFAVNWLRLRVSKPGALSGSRDVGLVIEREAQASSQKVFLGIGSNIDKENAIYRALTLLDKAFGTLLVSPVFESEAVGFDGENFYNLVISFETSIALSEIILIYKEIEDKLGRDRSGPKFSARTLDIDPLLYGDKVIKEPVILPREEILENAFVLWPLSLIAPTEKHPLTGKSFAEHWNNYEKQQKLWQVDFVWP